MHSNLDDEHIDDSDVLDVAVFHEGASQHSPANFTK
jgi:hypothetical protein